MKELVELGEQHLHLGGNRARGIDPLQSLTDSIGKPRRRYNVIAALRVAAEEFLVGHGLRNDPIAKMLHKFGSREAGRR